MKIDNITIKDIAKALKLSYSTVSRALQGSYKISEATRQLVNEYARAHNYRPNLMAQSLKKQKSRCIGVVLCSIPNNFFAEVISGIEAIAYSKDYLLIITQNLESYQREVKNLENLTWRSVDGLLISLSTETKDFGHFQKLYEQGLPMVFFDRVTDAIPAHKVITDNIGGAYEATCHLIERGYKRIATITGSPILSITQERLEGYKKALAENNIPVQAEYIEYCSHGGMMTEEIEAALQHLLQLPEPPDALLTASDRITIGSYSFIRSKGLCIPNEIAVAGFSNFKTPELFNPPLTTIRQNAFEMGKQAAELLIKQVESKRPVTSFEKWVLPTELIVRSSS